MQKKYQNRILSAITILIFSCLYSCTKQLDQSPPNSITNTKLYSTMAGYKQSCITLYGTLSTLVNQGGNYPFLRLYWNLQELPTDEAISTWNDPVGIQNYHLFSWTSTNAAVTALYNGVMYNITLCNNFIMESTNAKISARGYTNGDADSIRQYAAEARFIRAYYYWIMMDVFGNPPFATDSTLQAGAVPKQIQRKDLFNYIESELKSIEPVLKTPGTNEYGRADQAADWSLLARMYLNAEVYTDAPRYTDAITYCNKITNAGTYSLINHYNWLMLADNYLNRNEFIFTINFDNGKDVTYGGTNYLVLGPAGVPSSVNGITQTWDFLRFTQSVTTLFPTTDTMVDKRGEFWTQGQQPNADVIGDPRSGYSSYKFRNLLRDGTPSPQRSGTDNSLSDVDFPIFRLPEIYLIYAESVLRGGSGGDATRALSYINQLRGRAYANDPSSTSGNIAANDMTLNFILDERARELYWECHRRTDLIRYKELTTGSYLWAWKGGVLAGAAVADMYNVFPLPAADILANPNLKQNAGY